MQPTTFQPSKLSSVDIVIFGLAMAWGACLLLPIGLQYVCFLLLTLVMAFSGRFKLGWQQYRHEKFLIGSMLAFLGITALTLLLQDRFYTETPSNLWHGVRIVLTLMVALSLKPHEATRALQLSLMGIGVISLLVLAHWLGLLSSGAPALIGWVPKGNKWITMSVLLSAVSVWSVAQLLRKAPRSYFALIVGVLALWMVVIVMYQRTALLTVVVGVAAMLLARWRKHPLRLLYGWLGLSAVAAVIGLSVPQIGQKLELGITEVQQSIAENKVSHGSMVIRYHLYTKTLQMIQDKPLTGWGIGGWNTQWKERSDPMLHASNMPHNDFLWMGSQAGWPGGLVWLALMLSLVWLAWKQHHPAGHLSFGFAVIVLVNALINSGTRDAVMGLSLLFTLCCSIVIARSERAQA